MPAASSSYGGGRQPAMADRRPSRRHAAPDTSTNIAGVEGEAAWLDAAPAAEAEFTWPEPDAAWSLPESDPLAPGWAGPGESDVDQSSAWSHGEPSRTSSWSHPGGSRASAWSHAERNGASTWSDPDPSRSGAEAGWTEPEPSRGYGLSTGPITSRDGYGDGYGPDPLAVPDRTRSGHRRW